MKVICAIDFSETSINACKWIYSMLTEIENSSLHLVHCISLRKRSDVFLNVFDTLKYRAIDDIEELEQELSQISEDVKLSFEVLTAHPKEYLAQISRSNRYDLIVTGTKGLSALKDMTIGSVTEYLMYRSSTPILTIPKNCTFEGLDKIILGLGPVKHDLNEYDFLINLANHFDSKIHLVNVVENGQEYSKPYLNRNKSFNSKRASFEVIEKEDSIAETLEDFTDEIDGQLICLIHQKRNWFKRLFHKSVVKRELFNIETPLLILSNSKMHG